MWGIVNVRHMQHLVVEKCCAVLDHALLCYAMLSCVLLWFSALLRFDWVCLCLLAGAAGAGGAPAAIHLTATSPQTVTSLCETPVTSPTHLIVQVCDAPLFDDSGKNFRRIPPDHQQARASCTQAAGRAYHDMAQHNTTKR